MLVYSRIRPLGVGLQLSVVEHLILAAWSFFFGTRSSFRWMAFEGFNLATVTSPFLCVKTEVAGPVRDGEFKSQSNLGTEWE